MSKIDILYDRWSYVTRERDPEDEWDNDSTAADWTVHGLKLVEDKAYSEMTVAFDVVKGKTYYLVMADYGTGDSFGSYDNYLEFVDLFQTHEAAKAAELALLTPPPKDPNNWYSTYQRTYVRDNGESVTVSVPWEGYFDHLNDLHILEVEVV